MSKKNIVLRKIVVPVNEDVEDISLLNSELRSLLVLVFSLLELRNWAMLIKAYSLRCSSEMQVLQNFLRNLISYENN